MAKWDLKAPPIGKDGLQIDEKRSFQRCFWIVERCAWALFGLAIALALAGLTGSGGYFADGRRMLSTGTVEYSRFLRWEASDEFRFLFEEGGETRRLTIAPAFYRYFQVEGIEPQPERSVSGPSGVVMEFAAEAGAPAEVTIYVRPLHPGFVDYGVALDGAATELSSFILP